MQPLEHSHDSKIGGFVCVRQDNTIHKLLDANVTGDVLSQLSLGSGVENGVEKKDDQILRVFV